MISQVIRLILCLAAGALPMWGQQSKQATPPASGLRDSSSFFSRAPELQEKITGQLDALRSGTGFRLYVVVEPVLIGSTADEMARELQEAWLPDGNGLVLVFEADSRSTGFARPASRAENPAEISPGRLPPSELMAILARTIETMDRKQPPEVLLEATVTMLTSEISGYFARQNAAPPAGRSLRMGLFTIGILCLLALAALAVVWMLRRSDAAGSRGFTFPAVDRPERLGAPFGGGEVTVRRFGKRVP